MNLPKYWVETAPNMLQVVYCDVNGNVKHVDARVSEGDMVLPIQELCERFMRPMIDNLLGVIQHEWKGNG